jgi:hypothetical protein
MRGRSILLFVVLFSVWLGCGKPSRDQSPITDADKVPPAGGFDIFAEPLQVGMVGKPYSLEIVTAIDESHAVAKMRFSNRSGTVNAASEMVYATVPTAGIVSGHGYHFTKTGPVLATGDPKYNTFRVFKVTGTTTYGSDTMFVIKPVD